MNKLKFFLFLFFLITGMFVTAQVKMGDNSTNIGTSSLLEIESTNKALVVTRISNTSDIAQPINGMIVYDLSENKFKIFQRNEWTYMFI